MLSYCCSVSPGPELEYSSDTDKSQSRLIHAAAEVAAMWSVDANRHDFGIHRAGTLGLAPSRASWG